MNVNYFRNFSLNEDEKTYDWPEWKPNANGSDIMWRAVGRSTPSTPSWFVAAGLCFDDLEQKLRDAGWTKQQSMPEDRYTQEKFMNGGYGITTLNYVKMIEESGDLQVRNMYNSNVVPNLKESFWKSADGKRTAHISTWESFTYWIDSESKPTNGIFIQLCNSSSFKHCSANPITWGGGELNI